LVSWSASAWACSGSSCSATPNNGSEALSSSAPGAAIAVTEKLAASAAWAWS
jgi:hypothetical protein